MIGRTARLCAALVPLLACHPADRRAELQETETAAQELVLAPHRDAGLIGSGTSEAGLRARFGEAQVRQEELYVGEGEYEPGTILFPDDPLRLAEILWHDPGARTRPARVLIRDPDSRWMIPPGIGIGVSLDSLEALNGAPFVLAGFGWDYEGTVVGWEGGALEALAAGGLRPLIRLGHAPDPDVGELELRAVGGEGPFPSTHPVMRRLNPTVREMGFLFEDLGSADERERVAMIDP